MLQMSNLLFLSKLTIRAIPEENDKDFRYIGFAMTSAVEPGLDSLRACGSGWQDCNVVRSAWVDAVQRSAEEDLPLFNSQGQLWERKLGYRVHRALVKEIVSLLCLITEHCPQLTRDVSVLYFGPGLFGDELYDLAEDVKIHQH